MTRSLRGDPGMIQVTVAVRWKITKAETASRHAVHRQATAPSLLSLKRVALAELRACRGEGKSRSIRPGRQFQLLLAVRGFAASFLLSARAWVATPGCRPGTVATTMAWVEWPADLPDS